MDGHVHIHPCFDLGAFFDSAARNFARGSGPTPPLGVLLLTETFGTDRFAELEAAAGGARQIGGWKAAEGGEEGSLLLSREDAPDLLVLAGRQIVVRERLEVLALCTRAAFRDGGGLEETLDRVRATQGVPVVPWGFGKWWFGRGRIVADLLRTSTPGELLLGDNGVRPLGTPSPRHFRLARANGIGVLAGSDPLPFPAQARRPGHYGTLVPGGDFDPARPVSSLRTILPALPAGSRTFGRREPPHRFVEAQVRIRLGSSGC